MIQRRAPGSGTARAPSSPGKGITSLRVAGFKSIFDQQEVQIYPLTILAGANSSGKSSVMQPLLLLKQTLEAPYDPGPLLLSGQNVRFSSVAQVLSRVGPDRMADRFSVEVREGRRAVAVTFGKSGAARGFTILDTVFRSGDRSLSLDPEDVRVEDVYHLLAEQLPAGSARPVFGADTAESARAHWSVSVERQRCFLVPTIRMGDTAIPFQVWPSGAIQEIIHVPGLRGNPERTYPMTAVGPRYPGTFEKYVASVVARWKADKNMEALVDLAAQLSALGLTSKIDTQPVDDAALEILVGRLPRAKGNVDLVSLADVGFGVSQVLPVLVALLAARPGQLVYVEQPEIHLHPRSQAALARILGASAGRGVQVVIETHSAALLRAIQTEVAKGRVPKELIRLHWFRRLRDGSTQITSAEMDSTGAFGAWPEDFDEVSLQLDRAYLDAVEAAQYESTSRSLPSDGH